jgi:hypothetical protein
MLEQYFHVLHAHAGEVIAALAGALAGSFASYWLQRWNENRRDREDKRAAIVKAQVLLTVQINTLTILWEKHLKPHEIVANREQKIGPILFSECDPIVDINSLVFLVTRKHPQITFAIHMSQRSYTSALDALRYRNALHAEMFLKTPVITLGAPGEVSTVQSDKRSIMVFKAATDELYRSFPLAIDRCKKSHRELRAAGIRDYSSWFSKRFSKHGFLRITDDPLPTALAASKSNDPATS